jgi:hypothetical protein
MLTERWEGDETTGCFDCSMEPCHHDKYANCARRIAHAAELARSRSEGAPDHSTAAPSVQFAELPEQRL